MAKSGFLDTSVVVRYLVGDAPELAERAAQIIDSDAELVITHGILAEIAYVLTKNYNVPREIAVDRLIDLVGRANIKPYGLDKGIVVQALMMCRPSGRVSFADALLWATAHASGLRNVYSLDERFPSDGITVRQDPVSEDEQR